jgi:hypothetical protein
LLDHILANRDGRRVAVIVDDMSEVNIDRDGIRASLGAAVLDDAELAAGTNARLRFPDPLPTWEAAREHAH